eukprot:CAMPEP_0171087072 /NCGR_PEP_ID=MMETSP0766_2-20121228/19932_1 /TAXON_ID=439317 /ORGANISM="Gambierdiscus australes, Strain CAWD 149" /LENGTH=683 /DNA_ID=CAMNT_0011544757 /DNA_START=24 /DNA_END=2075 /DNA_ORIENTATION=-
MHRRWRTFLAVSVLGLAKCHPNNLICKDPRIVEGGMMMHNYVVSNQFTAALGFSASASAYEAGTRIKLTVTANGSKYVNESAPKGVYLAIQSRSACTLVGDHGSFSDFSEDFEATSGCASGIFSKTKGGQFEGSSSAVWTAGSRTTGNVTFTLLWSNGPGATDPMAVAGTVRVPDTYLFMKTITVTGPTGHCPPLPAPAPAPKDGSPDRCVWKGGEAGSCPVAGVGSPVFVQDLQEDGEVTFPSGRCLPCRIDHRKTCKSAIVSCPSEPGGPLKEQIWAASKDCTGPATRVAYLSRETAYCPQPEHYSVDSLDLERFVSKLQRDHGHHVKDEVTARAAVEEYRRMLTLIQRFPDQPVVPSKLVDLVWHEHILDTEQYKRDCFRMFGRYIHHKPSFGGEDEKVQLQKEQLGMFKAYMKTFSEPPPAGVWPTVKKTKLGAGGPLPDCCSALCAKPSCHDCVGCNSVDCGKVEGRVAHTSPDSFAGYVPATNPSLSAPAAAPYACSLSLGIPVGSPYTMSLDWTICGDRIYFQQSLAGLSAWYSLGLAGKDQTDMGFADYMLSMMTRNYTGVKDLYKYDAGNGYPCWDVLYECSVGNVTKGTKDVENDIIRRTNGVTTTTWDRKLVTPDSKDRPITRGNMTVLFAHGTEDYFTYHKLHRGACQVDFFSGLVACGAKPGQSLSSSFI